MEYQEEYSRYQTHFLGERPEFIEVLEIDLNHKRVIDLGCGGGINSYYLKERYPGSRIIPLDFSLIRCQECRKNTGTTPVQADIQTIPLKSASVDFVVCAMVIEHLPEDRRLVKEISRVLKKGGMAWVSSVMKDKYAWYFRKNPQGIPALDATHLREYRSEDQFKALFGDFQIKRAAAKKISFSPLRFLYRSAHKRGVIKQADSRAFLNNPILNTLSKFKLTIPGYYAIEVLLLK